MANLIPRDERLDRPTLRISSTSLRRALTVVACVLAIGCRRSETIQAYNVPKQTVARVATASPSAEPTDRMLAAVLPDGDKAWFFKVVAPLTEIDQCADKVIEFFASVHIAAGKPHPDWQLSDGWEERPGTGLRIATLEIPTSGTPLDLSVTSLPWTGAQADLLDNVNRWRGQMQLEPIGPQGLADCTRELDNGGSNLVVIDLRGRLQSTGMTPSFPAGGPLGGKLTAQPSVDEIPPGHPSFSASRVADHITLEYDLPDGWQTLPASGFRKAAFRVADGTREATVTVIAFPATSGPLIADPLANVNRWRSEVGLEPLSAAHLSADTEPIEIDNLQAFYVEAVPAASHSEKPNDELGTLAALATGDDIVWFFKITGEQKLVIAQRKQFTSFLHSVRLTAGDESSNGN